MFLIEKHVHWLVAIYIFQNATAALKDLNDFLIKILPNLRSFLLILISMW